MVTRQQWDGPEKQDLSSFELNAEENLIFLEEGPRNDWFEDQAVLILAIVSAVWAVAFFWRVLTARFPIVDLRAFTNRNYSIGSLFNFTLGAALYGLTYLSRLSRADPRL